MKIVKEENHNKTPVAHVEIGKVFQRENGDIFIKTPEVTGGIDSIAFNAIALSDTKQALYDIPVFEKVTILNCELHIL